jgi:uncharacterized protein (DUF983 family)
VDEPDSTCESCGLTASDSGNDVGNGTHGHVVIITVVVIVAMMLVMVLMVTLYS